MHKIFLCFLFLVTSVVFAQDKVVKHTVEKGETIFKIAGIYKVTVAEIFRLNPAAEKGIKENDILLISGSVTESDGNSSTKTHLVKAKETLYSIARDYKVAFADLKTLNEATLVDGLKIGQIIRIPEDGLTTVTPTKEVQKTTEIVEKPKETVAEKPKNDKTSNFHIVEAKETKFGIAKKYGMTVAELEELNPEIVANLPIGFKLNVKGNAVSSEVSSNKVEKPKPVVIDYEIKKADKSETTSTIKKTGYANYEVKQKETLYSLTQTLGITQDELIELNPSLKEGVKEGMILLVPGKGSITIIGNSKYKDLTKTIQSQNKKQLVLLLPFNATKVQSDTINKIATRLKKDSFLNMTLDFYSGALMAIEYGKSLGLNIDVKILDSEESKLTSNVEKVVKENNLQNADVIIGPFYQQHAEKVAELVAEKNVPVISPLSKEIGKPLPNLYQSMPPADFAKSAIFDYMLAKKGNIIVVSDVKRQANKDFITKNYPSASFAIVSPTGSLDIASFKSLFKEDGMNYVVLDTEKTGMILSTTNLMLNDMKNYEIQLVIMEPNETLNFEEISMKRLTILKLLYPSLTRENASPESVLFETDYKKKNKILPNQFATRGFDITFDTMLRLSQGKTFAESVNEDKTEQLESKFEYAKKDSEGYINKGVYILEYQEDLTVKPVN
ncbi:MAG: LysM peptidoglycan-binding domain-containing protein [Flavobacterium sp.]|uniref:amino acid ABC transporter substrate-binding protein n=1 Tax=Flavobacterium sp. TaxID=239 RepID=UPI0022CC972A|nr:LysM peptidoglycan-binding domain-containing protein [Flavobacterium sp.]MCZ8197174.1 LysM peptidoglycan-binding domain-containing protein [Flavobacterium sp.]